MLDDLVPYNYTEMIHEFERLRTLENLSSYDVKVFETRANLFYNQLNHYEDVAQDWQLRQSIRFKVKYLKDKLKAV